MILNDGHTELDTSAMDDQPDSIPLVVEAVTTFEVHASTPSLLRLSGELDLASAPILEAQSHQPRHQAPRSSSTSPR